jgi:hypothetical protein
VPKRTQSIGRSYSGKFENLFHLVPEFEDFNWSTYLDRIEQVPAIYFRNVLGSAFYSGNLTDLEPYLLDAIERTLMPSSCEAFFRNNSLPFVHRDYYLSKIFQYAYDALVSGRLCFGEDAASRLTTELAKMPNESLPRLHKAFDVQHFLLWTESYEMNGSRGLADSLRLESLVVDVSPADRMAPASPSRISKHLHALKDESGLTWHSIAVESKVSQRWLFDIAAGNGNPSPETRKELSNYFSALLKRPVRL